MMIAVLDVFREESFELLEEFENAVLELEKTPGDAELLNQAFRALHTLKGSGCDVRIRPPRRGLACRREHLCRYTFGA